MADTKNVSADRMDVDNLKITVKDLQDGLKMTQAKVGELEETTSELRKENSALKFRVCEPEEGATVMYEHTRTLTDFALKVSTSDFTLELSYAVLVSPRPRCNSHPKAAG